MGMGWDRLAAVLLAGTVLAGGCPARAQFQAGGLVPVGLEEVAALEGDIDEMRGAGWTADRMDVALRQDGYVLDRAVLDGDVSVADGWGRGMVLEFPGGGPAGGGAYRSPGRQPTPFERGLAGVAGNVGNTDAEIWRAIENGQYGAWARLEGVLSGRSVTGALDQAVNDATGAVTRPVRRAIDDAADTVLRPIEDAARGVGESIKCAVGGSILGGVGTIASGIFGRGKATLGAQIAQYATQTAGNLCLGRQLSVQQRMVAPIGDNAVREAGSVSGAVLDSLGLLGADEVGRGYQDGASADLPPTDSLAFHRELRARTDRARREALATAALNVEAERAYAEMADRALDLSQEAPGQTAALQALAQLQRANEGAQAARQSSRLAFDTAALVAEEEDRASERLAAARRARFYSGLDTPAVQNAGMPGFNLFQ